MKKIIHLLVILVVTFSNAQHTISGTFSPADDFTWIIAYRLKTTNQVYVADGPVEEGKFSLSIPEDAEPGTYRMVYAIPQDEFYFDVIYNGTEDIVLSFSKDKGASFVNSKENILFHSYFKEMNDIHQKIQNHYTTQKKDKEEYSEISKAIKQTQSSYEEKSNGLIAQQFIKANKPYFSDSYESVSDFVKHRKQHYFDALDFDNALLQSSSFLTEKALNFVFTSLPLKQLSQVETEQEIQKNTKTLSNQLTNVASEFQFQLYYGLWKQAARTDYNLVADDIYESYLIPLASQADDKEVISMIANYNRIRIGAVAPEISWTENFKPQHLSKLDSAEHYVLVFWSSVCSHCLNELPKLESGLKPYSSNVKVIAVGIEDEKVNWEIESTKLNGFTHVLSLGKWESKYVKLYSIEQTPTYFILNKDKEIVAKPDNYEDVLSFLETDK